MCGGGGASQVTTSSGEVPKYIKSASKANIRAAGDYASKFGVDRPDEKAAYGDIRQNSDWASSMMPYQQALIQSLYGGGGMGQGQDQIRAAYGQANQAYQPYLQSDYLDPMSNPYLQPAIEAAKTGAFNDVADRFHKAGRSFSGAEASAYGTGAANAALPMLLGQYNTNVGNQMGAAQGVLSNATGASGALNQAQQGLLSAQMAAPDQLNNLNIPANMLLGITDRQRQAALSALNARNAALSGSSSTYQPNQISTTKQNSDPFQSLLGGGLGLLGMFM